MKTFKIKVRNSADSFDFINIQAETAQQALAKAQSQGYNAIEASEENTENSINIFKRIHVPDAELYHFTRLFATLTKAGIPLIETLELLTRRVVNPTLKNSLSDICERIKDGNGLTLSFAAHPQVFEKTYLQLLEVGEESGNLPKVLERLTFLLQKRIKLRSMVVKALTYPVLVVVLSTLVVAAILIKIVPRFKEIYSKFGGELPAMTKFTLSCSDILINYFPFLIGFLLITAGVFYFGKRTRFGKKLYDRITLGLPLFGNMFHTYEIAGFAKSFSMLVHSGITVTSSLDLIEQSVNRWQISEALRKANLKIKNGETIASGFDEQMPWLPELLNRMVAVGERSGNLPEMLDHVADFYEEEFNNKIETIASLIEPVLIVFLGIVIGGIVVSLYLPIFGMAKLISQR